MTTTIIFQDREQAQRVLQLIEDNSDITWESGTSPTAYNPFDSHSRIVSIGYPGFGAKGMSYATVSGSITRPAETIKADYLRFGRVITAKGMTVKAWKIMLKRL